jgi:hypothetical protein
MLIPHTDETECGKDLTGPIFLYEVELLPPFVHVGIRQHLFVIGPLFFYNSSRVSLRQLQIR